MYATPPSRPFRETAGFEPASCFRMLKDFIQMYICCVCLYENHGSEGEGRTLNKWLLRPPRLPDCATSPTHTFIMVSGEGLEPSRIAPHGPQPCASAKLRHPDIMKRPGTHGGTRTHNHRVLNTARLPIAPHGYRKRKKDGRSRTSDSYLPQAFFQCGES